MAALRMQNLFLQEQKDMNIFDRAITHIQGGTEVSNSRKSILQILTSVTSCGGHLPDLYIAM